MVSYFRVLRLRLSRLQNLQLGVVHRVVKLVIIQVVLVLLLVKVVVVQVNNLREVVFIVTLFWVEWRLRLQPLAYLKKKNSENDLHQIVNLHDHHLKQKENYLYHSVHYP